MPTSTAFKCKKCKSPMDPTAEVGLDAMIDVETMRSPAGQLVAKGLRLMGRGKNGPICVECWLDGKSKITKKHKVFCSHDTHDETHVTLQCGYKVTRRGGNLRPHYPCPQCTLVGQAELDKQGIIKS